MSRNILFIINGPPYGSEHAFNGLRLARAVAAKADSDVRVFLMGDAVGCAVRGQQLPNGYYHLDRILEGCARHGAEIACCATCMDARGLAEDVLVPSARRGSVDELADWTLWADQSVTF